MKKYLMMVALGGAVSVGVLAGEPAVITGLNRSTSYGLYNHIYQWEIGATSNACRNLGTVNIGSGGLFGADLKFRDVAVLSDRRLAVTHTNAASGYVISVLTMQYDGSGLLTGATVDATVSNIVNGLQIAPLPNGAFVTHAGTSASVWEYTGSNAWTSTLVGGINSTSWDVAGLIRTDTPQFLIGEYITPSGGSGARSGHKYGKAGKLASYLNSDMPGLISWGYGYFGEGLRHPLLVNGWITTGYSGNSYETYLYDGTQTDVAWHDGYAGEITEAGATPIYDRQVASLQDGRVAIWWLGGWMKTSVGFKIFSIVQDPGGRTGTVGADGEDFYVEFSGNYCANMSAGGILTGDYMYVPPPFAGTVFRFR